MKYSVLAVATVVCFITLVQSCSQFEPAAPADDEILDGPVDGLTYEQRKRFLKGDEAFNKVIFTETSGLGPLFVATSCGGCHAGDGKGTPFTTLTRYGQADTLGNSYLNNGGPQLQNRAIPGYQPEQLPQGTSYSNLTPPANTGLGFIELVPDAELLSLADPLDADGDGISGRPNYHSVPTYVSPSPDAIPVNGKYICRFGKKGATYNLLQQTANAYNQDIGIASVYEHYDVYSGDETDPEVSAQTVLDVVFYLQTLKAPIQRNKDDEEVVAGEQLFISIGCEKCHKQELHTGYSSVDALTFKTIYPYSDLLLHDMGSQLNDGYTEGNALTSEWRTPPLWGLGLSKNSQGGQYFLLHDGRATSIEAAISFHGGEAEISKTHYNMLTAEEKKSLIKFLESL